MARWLEVIGTYNLEIQHRAGRVHNNADALSRRPCTDCRRCALVEEKEGFSSEPEVSCENTDFVRALTNAVDRWVSAWSEVDLKERQQADPALVEAVKWVQDGEKPDWGSLGAHCSLSKSLWQLFDELKVRDGCLFRKSSDSLRLVVPESMRREVLTSYTATEWLVIWVSEETLVVFKVDFGGHVCVKTLKGCVESVSIAS